LSTPADIRNINVTDASAPRASIIIPAFNLARFLPDAINSALAQQSPGGAIEVIVVDDGSSDETPEVVARYGDRIRAVRQQNAGTVAAVSRGIEMSRGEFIAQLDADDRWPVDRLARHIAVLDAEPNVGLVHGDMAITDQHGNITAPSYFASQQIKPQDGRILGNLLAGNFVSGGASTYRASLLPALFPFSDDAAWEDWWIATCVATVAEIRVVDGIANLYRFHGANNSLGTTLADQPRIQRREIGYRRWMYRNLLLDSTIGIDHLAAAFASLRFGLLAAASDQNGGARSLLIPDRDKARSLADSAPAASRGALRSRALLKALANDPFDGAIAIDLELALAAERQLPPSAPEPPLIALETRAHVTLAWHDEVAGTPALLRALAADPAFPTTTLVILTRPGADLSNIQQVFAEDQHLDSSIDATVVVAPTTTPAQELLSHRADDRLTLCESPAPYAHLPLSPAVERATT
jgi:glycosyltransferase involved in cell wall biosynthesis